MHSNIGYIVTLALNLSLLLPLANNPKVNNYVLVLYVCYHRLVYAIVSLITHTAPMAVSLFHSPRDVFFSHSRLCNRLGFGRHLVV